MCRSLARSRAVGDVARLGIQVWRERHPFADPQQQWKPAVLVDESLSSETVMDAHIVSESCDSLDTALLSWMCAGMKNLDFHKLYTMRCECSRSWGGEFHSGCTANTHLVSE